VSASAWTGESGAGGGAADQFDDDLIAGQGLSLPVAGDRREQSVLGLAGNAAASGKISVRITDSGAPTRRRWISAWQCGLWSGYAAVGEPVTATWKPSA
jgi:hypothetical protein